MQDKPPRRVKLILFARLLIIFVPKSYILVIYTVFYDYLWQSCGCTFLDIPPPI
jgi:hypothetical protein